MNAALEEHGQSAERMQRELQPGLSVTSAGNGAYREFHLRLTPLPGEPIAAMVRRLRIALEEREAEVVRHEVFASPSVHEEVGHAMKRAFGGLDWPVTWAAGTGAWEAEAISGMHVFAVAGVPVDTAYLGGQPVGRTFDDGDARHCLVAGLEPTRTGVSAEQQCRGVFEDLERALTEAGMQPSDLVRTWFSLQDILSWYDSFNTIRNEVFGRWNLFDGVLPASTGVGMNNNGGAAVVAGAWAMQPRAVEGAVRQVNSPLQNPSLHYGSAFSRAVCIPNPAGRRLLVSGTASIAPDGCSLHAGDVQSQMEVTMEVVEQLLRSQGGHLQGVTRATAYLKTVSDAPLLEAWLARRNLPFVAVQSDICRKELLFEMELDALVA